MSWISNNQPVDVADNRQKTKLSRKQQCQVETYCETGKKLLGEGKKLQALEYFQVALEIDDACVEAWSGVVSVYKGLGKVNKAEEAQQKLTSLLRGSMDLKKLGRNIKRLLVKYRFVAKHGVTKKGRDTLGVGIFGFSAKAEAKLAKIEDDINALNVYFIQSGVGRQRLDEIRKRCVDKRVRLSWKWTLFKQKDAYRWLVLKSGKVAAGEKQLRNKIEALDPKKGRDWCDKFNQRLQWIKKEVPRRLPKILKIIGIVLAVGLGLFLAFIVIRFIIRNIVSIIIGGVVVLAIIGYLGD